MLIAPGTRVDRYVVESLLGAGGMAEVYAVRHEALGSPAALKILRVRSPQLVARMRREGRAQARLQHPNVVAVLDLIEVDGAPGLVMERVDGPSLAQVLASGPLLPDRFERIARGLMSGLHAAHAVGVVHRDLKPANVLIARGDVVRIADFGLATALGDDEVEPGLTRPGTALGTPAYMAPEQHEDAHRVDARADLFALGVVLYEMAVGAAPAAGANLVHAWQTMSRKTWRSPRQIDPRVSERVDRAIRWALEPGPADRVPSVPALWGALLGEPFPGDPGATFVIEAPSTVVPSRSSAPGSPPPATPPATPPGGAGIPRPARALVGREAELAAAWDALEARGTLHSLVGTGGAGKTRLAIELARRWTERGRPALWVDLQAARHDTDLLQAIAWRLDDGTEPRESMIGRSLGRRGAALLVLDNVEQLPRAAGAVIAGLVRTAPSLRVLVTSRHPLGVGEEEVTELAPLPVPEEAGEVPSCDAWRMFCAAASHAPIERVDPAQAQRILRALDGLPLAIELAAARLEVLELDELERRLADRFAVLSDPEGAGERHGALYDAIDWSWSLLADEERAALAQLSAFAAPFPLAAAEAVVRAGSVLDALHGLVRRSMVRRSGARFSVLQSIREFAERQLGPAERAQVWRRHATFHADRARGIARSRDPAVLRELTDLAPELEVALARAVGGADHAGPALRGAVALVALHERWSPPAAVLRVCELALGLPAPAAPSVDPRGPTELGGARAPTGRDDLEGAAFSEAGSVRSVDGPSGPPAASTGSPGSGGSRVAERLGSGAPGAEGWEADRARLRVNLGFARRRSGDPEGARAELESLLADPLPPEVRASALANLADVRADQGDDRGAVPLYREALALAEAHGPAHVAAVAAMSLAAAVEPAGMEADRLIERAYAALSPGDRFSEIEVRKTHGWLELHRNRLDGASEQYRRVLAAAEEAKVLRTVATATGQLGIIAEAQDRLEEAAVRYRAASEGLQQLGDPIYAAYYLGYLGRVELRLGRWSDGTTRLGQALAVPGMTPTLRTELADALALAFARAGEVERALATETPENQGIGVRLARAFQAVRAGDRATARQELERVRALLPIEETNRHNLVAQLVGELEAEVGAWRIASDGGWAEGPAGERIDLARHAANARILARLVELRDHSPGVAADVDLLAAAGWPGERIVAAAAANRVRVALSALRREGLAELIERVDGGWRLDPARPVQRVTIGGCGT